MLWHSWFWHCQYNLLKKEVQSSVFNSTFSKYKSYISFFDNRLFINPPSGPNIGLFVHMFGWQYGWRLPQGMDILYVRKVLLLIWTYSDLMILKLGYHILFQYLADGLFWMFLQLVYHSAIYWLWLQADCWSYYMQES